MRSPRIGSASGVITTGQFELFVQRPATKEIRRVSRATSLRSRFFSSKGAFFRRLRILRMTSAGAPVITAKYRSRFPRVQRYRGFGRFQDACCGFGVRQNRAERLVDFVGNGGGQFASRREAVDMGKFGHALPRLHFGQPTPTMLTQQDRDQPGLYEKNRER